MSRVVSYEVSVRRSCCGWFHYLPDEREQWLADHSHHDETGLSPEVARDELESFRRWVREDADPIGDEADGG